MPVPDFQTLMLPALRVLERQSPSTTGEVRRALAEEFALSEADLAELLPSGRQTTFANRVAWAYSYLKQAGLISSPRRGAYEITFQAFRQASSSDEPVEPSSIATRVVELTPDEQIRAGYKRLRESLGGQLLERVKAVSPGSFEQLVVDVLVGLGYGGTIADAGMVVGGGGDEGIDGIIKEDRLGLDYIYVQAKRWQSTVGRPEIQRFAGALLGQRARKGIFITTSSFSADAVSYAANQQVSIVLIDGRTLVELMMDAQIGVSHSEEIRVLRTDEDYFDSLEAS